MNLGAKTVLLTLACLGGSAALPHVAQDPERPHPARASGGKFELKAGEHSITDLIERVSLFLRHNYLHDDVARAGDVSVFLQNSLQLDEAGCEEVFSQLLYAKGFALVPVSSKRGIFEIIAMNGPRRNEIQSRATWMTPDDVRANREKLITVITSVALKHVNAQTATTTLRPFFSSSNSPGGGLIPGNVGDGQSLLLQGFAPSVAAAIDMLQRVDVPAADQDTLDALVRRIQSIEKRLEALESK